MRRRSMTTWHMIAEQLTDPTDEDCDTYTTERFAVEADSLTEAYTAGRALHPNTVVELLWVSWEPWPGLVLRVDDARPWFALASPPGWLCDGHAALLDCAPLPAGLQDQDHARKLDHLLDQPRFNGWTVGGLVGPDYEEDRQQEVELLPPAGGVPIPRKGLALRYARILQHPRVVSISSGEDTGGPVVGLDAAGRVVVVMVGLRQEVPRG
jgi:hypothetical protein